MYLEIWSLKYFLVLIFKAVFIIIGHITSSNAPRKYKYFSHVHDKAVC